MIRAHAADPVCRSAVASIAAGAKRLRRPAVAFVVLSAAVRGSSSAGENRWTQTGPAATVYALAIDPRPGGVLYASTELGLYRSDDHAATWTFVSAFPAGLQNAGLLAVDPLNDATLFAGANELFKSTDGGISWTVVSTPINPGYAPTSTIAFHPSAPGTLYTNSRDRLYRTQDGGVTWALLGPLANVFGIAVDPLDPQRVYFGTDFHIYYSEDGVATWHEGLGERSPIRQIVPSRGVSNIVYATADCCAGSGVERSLDFGGTWDASAVGLEVSGTHAIALDPTAPGGLFATGGCGPSPGSLPPPSVPPVFRSANGGQTWNKFSAGLEPCMDFYFLVVDETGRYVHAAGLPGSGTFTYHLASGVATAAVPAVSGVGLIALAAMLAAAGALALRRI